MNQIATLLTCHNRRAKTLACLEALYACELPEGNALDVFLVDDGSTDGTGDAVREHYPAVNVIQGDGNLYWNRGMYLALQTACKYKSFDYYLWLNDDTQLKENAISTMLKTIIKTKNKSIVVGSTCSTIDHSYITYGGRDLNGRIIFPLSTPVECSLFNGNIVLIPNYVLNIVGFNDPKFHHALGDFDYGLRANKLGIKSYIAPGILGICEEHLNDPKWRNTKFSLFNRLIHLYSPTGNNPIEFFIYERRHNGLFLAIFRFFTIHLRSIAPKIWEIKKTTHE